MITEPLKERLLSVDAAAKYLSVSRRTMQTYLHEKVILAYRNGRIVRVDRLDLDKHIDSQKC